MEKMLTRILRIFVGPFALPGALFVSLAGSVSTIHAQFEATQETVSKVTARLEVFKLRYLSAQSAMPVLQTLMAGQPGVRISADNENRIIVFADAGQLETVRETLEVLDQAPDNHTIKVFSLMNSEATTVAEIIELCVDEVTVAIDSRTNSLVVSAASEQALELVEQLAMHLDKRNDALASGSYQLDLFWLIEAGDVDGQDTGLKQPDPRIEAAALELGRQGFASIRQVARVGVVVKSGGRFQIRSTESLGQLDVEGRLDATNDQQLELTLNLEITQPNAGAASIMSEIITQANHNVVIGIASATQPQRRSAFVIRVEK